MTNDNSENSTRISLAIEKWRDRRNGTRRPLDLHLLAAHYAIRVNLLAIFASKFDQPEIFFIAQDIKQEIDETRLIVAAMPAQTVDELEAKCIMLDGDDAPPEFERHALIPVLAKASVQADLRRLRPKPAPEWARPWVGAKKRI
jgi:hypothetical protein